MPRQCQHRALWKLLRKQLPPLSLLWLLPWYQRGGSSCRKRARALCILRRRRQPHGLLLQLPIIRSRLIPVRSRDLPVRVGPAAQACSADGLFSIVVHGLQVQVADRAVARVMGRVQVHPAATIPRVPVRLAHAAPCIPRVLLRPGLRVHGRALLRVPVVRVPGLVLARGPVALVERLVPADCCRPVKHHVRSVRVVRHAVVDVSSIRRPKKAR